jgi:hypothetical protein
LSHGKYDEATASSPFHQIVRFNGVSGRKLLRLGKGNGSRLMLLGVPGHALDFGDLREQASRPEVLLIPRFLPAQSIDNAETRFEVCFDSLPSATSPQPFSRGDRLVMR